VFSLGTFMPAVPLARPIESTWGMSPRCRSVAVAPALLNRRYEASSSSLDGM